MEDLIRFLTKIIDQGREARPDVPARNLLVPLNGDRPFTYAEHNAATKKMTFVCSRVADATRPGNALAPHMAPVPGSIKKRCGQCREEVWMSPATCQAMARIARPSIICLDCAWPDRPTV